MNTRDDPELEELRQQVQTKRDSLTDKLEQIGQNVTNQAEAAVEAGEDVVENVTHAFDIRYQARERPWATVGAAALVGYLAGRTLLPSEPHPGYGRQNGSYSRHSAAPESDRRTESQSSSAIDYVRSIIDEVGGIATTAATTVLMQVAHSMLQPKPDEPTQANRKS